MVSLTALALPILVAAVLVFLASSVIHMVLPFHRSDWRRLPAEDRYPFSLPVVRNLSRLALHLRVTF